MAGTWETQNKILPGAYINLRTNAPLSISPGDRGTVVLLQEMSVGNKGEIYRVTALEDEYPEDTPNTDKLLVNEALKGAREVLVYNLGTEHIVDDVTDALTALRTITFNTLCYPYDEIDNKQAIVTWIEAMYEEEGIHAQAVLPNQKADTDLVISVTQGILLENGTELTVEQVTAWVAGVTAGANINQSNTARRYEGAIDVVPRLTKTEMETAVQNGEFIFKVDSAQNVTAVYDVNSFATFTVEKGKMFSKNRVVRVIAGIYNDIPIIFESNYIGKVDNNPDGRSLLRATLIEYFNELQRMGAIQNFTAEDVTVQPGNDIDAVLIECYIQPVDSIEKIYINVNLS